MSKKCTHCKAHNSTKMEEIPLILSECEATRQHSIIKRLMWAVMLLTVLLFVSNFAWIVYGGKL